MTSVTEYYMTRNFVIYACHLGSEDSSVGIATECRLEGQGSIPGRGKIFSSPQRPDRLWSPPSLLSDGYRGHFTGCKAAGP
jgi:hypothetical protein